jgi:amino acid adenylation domain-containing protein
MREVPRRVGGFPASQQAVQAKCTHPTGVFLEFPPEAIERSIPERFEQQARQYPDRLVIDTGSRQLTYTALNEAANRVAWALMASRQPRDQPVAILLGQGPQCIATMLGVLKAGHFYVPLDPAYPLPRLTYMLEDSQAGLLITDSQHLPRAHELAPAGSQVLHIDRLAADPAAENPRLSIGPDGLACLLYTSGSTGQPKGVMHTHRSVLHMTMVATNALRLCAEDRLVLLYSPSFLAATRAIHLAVLNGAALFPFSVRDEGLAHFGTWLTRKGITVYYSIPTVFHHFMQILQDDAAFPSVRLIWLSGESIDPRDVALYRKHFSPDCVFIPFYGAAEAPGPVPMYFIDTKTRLSGQNVPLGYTAAGAEVLVCDEDGAEVGNNRTGEIAVKSRYLASGYWRQPGLTQAVFRPDPSGGEARIYYTGDLARRLPDGCLEHLGRKDWQVKIRGYRIDVLEVERVLLEMPAITEAAVMPWEFQDRDTRLAAYVVEARGAGVTASEVRRFLRAKLPEYMVPAVFIRLPALPLMPGGKVDRRALPPPNEAMSVPEEPFVGPRTAIEQQVAASWSELLGQGRVGIHDNFFELGAHSLLAMQLISRLSDAMQVDIPLRSFFETPTVVGLASAIETALQGARGQQTTAIQLASRAQALPASIAQEHIWIVDQVLQGLALFNILHAIRLRGLCDLTILQRSCDEIIRRHEALRTTFAAVGGRLVQVIAPTLSVPVTVLDLRALSTHERERNARQLAEAEVRRPFDLDQGPLLRLHLLGMDVQEHLLLVTMHHIVADGWSLGVLAHELAVLYDAFSAGEPSPLPELRIQYADFAHWQRQWRGHGVMAAQLAYWREQLRAPLPVLELPMDRPRGAASSFRTAHETLVLPGELLEALAGLSHHHGSTPFITLMAAFNMLLYGYTGQEDLCVATHTANRRSRDTEEVIGLFANTVLLRTDLRGDPTGREVLRRVRTTALGAYTHQDLPFEDLVQMLEGERGLRPSSLCQVMLIMQNAMQRPLRRSARTLSFLEAELNIPLPPLMVNTFDVVLLLREKPQGLSVSAIFKPHLFEATTITRMLGDFQHVLECLVREPEQPLSTFRSRLGDRSQGARAPEDGRMTDHGT